MTEEQIKLKKRTLEARLIYLGTRISLLELRIEKLERQIGNDDWKKNH